MRRPIQMVPPGNAYPSRPTKVRSSTCNRPVVTTDGAVMGTVGEEGTDIDFSDYDHCLDGQELFILNHALENGTDGDGLCYYTPYE